MDHWNLVFKVAQRGIRWFEQKERIIPAGGIPYNALCTHDLRVKETKTDPDCDGLRT